MTIAGLAMSAQSAFASLLYSAPGNGVCTMFDSTSCALQLITPHSAWQPNNPDGSLAKWVSYANTGVGPGSFEPPNSATNYLMQVAETIVVGPSKTAQLKFKVWADDTAAVYLNNVLIFAKNTSQNTCANGPIGCQPYEFKAFDILLAAGSVNTLAFQVYQIGGGPFGLLYTGSTSDVPEPGALALFAAAILSLFGFGLMRRRIGA